MLMRAEGGGRAGDARPRVARTFRRDWERELDRCRWTTGGPGSNELTVPPGRSALADFEVATEDLLQARALQKRVDTKFLLPRGDLPALFERLKPKFAVVLSSGSTVAHYETLYYDIDEKGFYRDHLRGRRPRVKVRVRRYVERGVCFLELKKKDKYGVISKFRRPRGYESLALDDADRAWLVEQLGADVQPTPSLRIDFPRATLVGRDSHERLTVDLGVHFSMYGAGVSLDVIGFVELKQARFSGRAPGMQALRATRARRRRMSKYCVGTAAVVDDKVPPKLRPIVRDLMRYHDA